MRGRGSQVALTLIFVLFGFMLATQFRARPPIVGNVQAQRAEELSLLLRATEDERDAFREENRTLRERVAELLAGEAEETKLLQEELEIARLLAGLSAVKGPGISIEMSDSKKQSAPGQDPNVFLIHDDDVMNVVNELFTAGAEAVSINGQRLVATSEIRCAGNVITINGVRLAPPLHILAIGDPKTLESGLKMRGGVVDSLTFWGIEVKIKMEEEIVVPEYEGSVNFKYAVPVPVTKEDQ